MARMLVNELEIIAFRLYSMFFADVNTRFKCSVSI